MFQGSCFNVQHANANSVVSFQYPNKEDCTILISKSNNKYRLQGTSYDALWLTMSELLARLHAYFGPEGVRMQLEEDVPVQWYQECIEGHFALRKDRQQLVCNLEQGAAQVWQQAAPKGASGAACTARHAMKFAAS